MNTVGVNVLALSLIHIYGLKCNKCPLAATRTNVVFGVGPEDAEVLFIGEGPGENEDLSLIHISDGRDFECVCRRVVTERKLFDKLVEAEMCIRDRS